MTTTTTTSPRLAFPEKFDGSPVKCKGFLLQCPLFIRQQPALYPTDVSRISFVCSLLMGKALEWATAVWSDGRPTFTTYDSFLQRFCEILEHPEGGKEAGEQLLVLCQGKSTAKEYALTGWVDDPLKLLFQKGLNQELQSELACHDEGRNLDQFINLSVRIDNLIRSRCPTRDSSALAAVPSASSDPEPMQIGYMRLSPEEKERRIRQKLCLYCGQPVHLWASCPTRPAQSNPSAVSTHLHTSSNAELPVVLTVNGNIITTTAMIDSGAAANLIDADFARSHDIPLIPCDSVLAVAALDGRPLGTGHVHHTTGDLSLQIGALHKETIHLFQINSPQNPLILPLAPET